MEKICKQKQHDFIFAISQTAKLNRWSLNECLTFHLVLLSVLVLSRRGMDMSVCWYRLLLLILKSSGKQAYCGS